MAELATATSTGGLVDLKSQSSAESFSWQVDAEAIDTHAKKLVQLATDSCPPIESRLKYLADKHQGKMVGLEFKIKPVASLVRKMNTMWKMPSQTIDDIVEMQYDVLRFTMLLPVVTYTEGVKSVLRELKEQEKCTSVEEKNYWTCHTYRGINTIYRTPSGIKFEVQFHTPESFDQKQNKTHLLYEALRSEHNPLKQNLYHLDMARMFDDIQTPVGAPDIGSPKSQPLPEPKNLSGKERRVIEEVVEVKLKIREELAPLFSSLRLVEPRLTPLIDYLCQAYGAEPRCKDQKFRGSLSVQRKLEEDLRRYIGANDAEMLHDLKLPPRGVIEAAVKELSQLQSDILLYPIVVPFDNYTHVVEGFLDGLRLAQFEIVFVDNHWHDHERHHPIIAGVKIPPDHPVRRNKPYALTFSVEFHTKESYEASILRATAKTQVEEHLYRKGMPYKKIFVDVNLRHDPALCEIWARVKKPKDAETIGKSHDISELLSSRAVEAKTHTGKWLTPAERRQRMAQREVALGLFIGGVALGVAVGRWWWPRK